MNDINSCILVGRLTRDGELTYTQNGKAVLKITLAVNRSIKQGEQWAEDTAFFDVTWSVADLVPGEVTFPGLQTIFSLNYKAERDNLFPLTKRQIPLARALFSLPPSLHLLILSH